MNSRRRFSGRRYEHSFYELRQISLVVAVSSACIVNYASVLKLQLPQEILQKALIPVWLWLGNSLYINVMFMGLIKSGAV